MTDMDELKKRLSYSDIETVEVRSNRRQNERNLQQVPRDRPTSFVSSIIMSDNQDGSVQRNDINILDEIAYIE